jgi:radical SAM protein with 4Fe4S-binding SPASM domain
MVEATRGIHFSTTEISLQRALQFCGNGGKPYRCTAGDTLLAVMPNGDVLPCRRMPRVVGNLLSTPLRTIYSESPLLRDLRAAPHIISGCSKCFYSAVCRGGLRCLSDAVYGSPFRADPGCWLVDKPQEDIALVPLPSKRTGNSRWSRRKE